LGPWFIGIEELEFTGQIPVTVVASGEGEQAREDKGARAVLAGGDVMVGSTEAATMELNHSDGAPAWRLTGGGPEVGEKLQGNKAVQLVTLARVEVVEEVDSHTRPRRWRRGQ
jgi:hypothetical protein